MNKEEILAISQNENKGKDVADVELSKTGIRAGWIVTVCLAVAAAVIDGAVPNERAALLEYLETHREN